MTPRSSLMQTRRTRETIIARAVEVASQTGLEGLTIGVLATDLGISKSGLLGHFGSKEALQLAVVDEAAHIFIREIPNRVAHTVPGISRLRALAEAWISYLERKVFPGGCFFIAAATEFDGRTGAVRNALTGLITLWQNDLRRQIQAAIAAHELPADTNPNQLIFDITGIIMSLNHALELRHDRSAPQYARNAMRRVLH